MAERDFDHAFVGWLAILEAMDHSSHRLQCRYHLHCQGEAPSAESVTVTPGCSSDRSFQAVEYGVGSEPFERPGAKTEHAGFAENVVEAMT